MCLQTLSWSRPTFLILLPSPQLRAWLGPLASLPVGTRGTVRPWRHLSSRLNKLYLGTHRRCIRGVSDLDQDMSALLGLVPKAYAVRWWMVWQRRHPSLSGDNIWLFAAQSKRLHSVGGRGTSPQRCSVQCASRRSIWCLSDAAQKWDSQHWKGPKISLLSTFLVLSYLTKPAILLLHPAGAKPSSLSLPQQVPSSSPPIIFTALCCARSSSSPLSCAGAPRPEAVLETRDNDCWVEGNNRFPRPMDYVWAMCVNSHHIQRESRLQFSA